MVVENLAHFPCAVAIAVIDKCRLAPFKGNAVNFGMSHFTQRRKACVPISFAEAALGAEIDIPMLGGGTEKYTIPEGTQTGTSFTMRGMGIADINTGRKGNLIFTVVVETPRNLNSEQKKLISDFGTSLGENNTKYRQSWFKKLFNK